MFCGTTVSMEQHRRWHHRAQEVVTRPAAFPLRLPALAVPGLPPGPSAIRPDAPLVPRLKAHPHASPAGPQHAPGTSDGFTGTPDDDDDDTSEKT
ncbi:hypothetical protein SKAU_G00323720 [Synaphobranchus kaupii]|uniref:Uncharacterized protein n=1 Tax=Synaphobranchus kaupii TaxID=118154 RepID=A0A9Q1EPA5_SYNKA|nr:hypothetical protein SKAU_G00323720 [Synaphobranchus kaupii]